MPMVKNPFNGQLNSNEIFASIFNMIISQDFYGDRLSALDSGLVSKFKVDGTLYGDTKLYYASDIFETEEWLGDSEASNLLAIKRPADPKCQAITIDQFRMVNATFDNYLSKRAWGTEGAFSLFQSVVMGYLSKTKKLYETLLISVYTGTVKGASNAEQSGIDVTLSGITETGEEKSRIRAQKIAQRIADLFDDLKTPSRDYNDYQFMDAFNPSDFYLIYNNKYANEITKIDLPTIFHKDNLINMQENLNHKFFGEMIDSSNIASYSDSTPAAGKPINSSTGAYTPGVAHANGTIRSAVEKRFTVGVTEHHVFPGDELPTGATIKSTGGNFGYGETYIIKEDIICKVIHKDAIKFMGAFEAATEFFNPRSLTSNHYLIWGYSKPDYLRNLPVLTVYED